MIRSVPNPPMDRTDIARFRNNLKKHLRGEYTAHESMELRELEARAMANAKRIIDNYGGKNPLLGY